MQAFLSIKPLLAKWAVICTFSIFLMSNFMLRDSAESNQSQSRVQRTEIIDSTGEPISEIKISEEARKQQSTLPPFKSESDIEAEKAKAEAAAAVSYSSNSSGNTYYSGYCTWYAKSKRPDLPNSLGNAQTWFSRAQSLGIPTGTEPKAGAIGQRGNHVVYVEKVNTDNTVSISEMNFRGFGITSTRTVPADTFSYIY